MAINTEKYQITVLKQSNIEQYSVYIPYDMIENPGKYQITPIKCVYNKLQKINLKNKKINMTLLKKGQNADFQ
jgi:hypothetical protein